METVECTPHPLSIDMLPRLTERSRSWLELVGEVARTSRPDDPDSPERTSRPDDPDNPEPLTFLLGAGASLSSGAPGTADILAACRDMRPEVFPDDDAVYDKFSTALTAGERTRIIEPLFRDSAAYVGYRCLVAMARSRPVYVVNLNWDSCLRCAGERVEDVPVDSFDLEDVEEGMQALDAACKRGYGVVCAHVHGYLDYAKDHPDAKRVKGIRFSVPDTLSFGGEELQLLERMLAPFTIVAGTSLIGPHDAHEVVKALHPPAAGGQAEDEAVKPLWVFERGPHARAPGFGSRIAVGLSNALLGRESIYNFVSNPDVDFDTMMVVLRASEAELPWPDGIQTETRLPSLGELLPPNPEKVESLLDEERSLLVGVPKVGTSALAYRLAWWRCLTDAADAPGARRIRGFQGPSQALAYLKDEAEADDCVGAIVIDDLYDERDPGGSQTELVQSLGEALARTEGLRVIATARPDTAAAACRGASPDSLHGVFKPTVVCGRSLWRGDDLRAWARARGGERAELVCREVRMGSVLTPSQAVRTLDGRRPHELEEKWGKRLKGHLDTVYDRTNPHSLLLAMLRLQDFSIPRSERSLVRIAGVETADDLIDDPWGLCATIEVDGERYLRLSHPGVVGVVDKWIAKNRPRLVSRLSKTGERGHWAVQALRHWRVFWGTKSARPLPPEFDREELELFGSEYVGRALQRDPVLALDVLERSWDGAKDHWTAKDVALDLVLHWEQLGDEPKARDLRDELLDARDEMGAYALFEAILRAGRPVSLELWSPVVSRILDFVSATGDDELARRQVALCFDALLWRPCPVSSEQERKLVRRLDTALRQDMLLNAAAAAASAYHYAGTDRVLAAGLRSRPTPGPAVSVEEALEMAWLLEWHFAHQSRCRAVASRRTFLSTVEDSHIGAPRYLDRTVRQDVLDEDQELAVMGVVDALLGHSETVGWGLHLIMNIHTTTGMFTVPENQIARLDRVLGDKEPDVAVVSAAITYMPADQIQELLTDVLGGEEGKLALQRGLGEGVTLEEGTHVAEPRFSMGSDPWAIRDRWRATPRLPFAVAPTVLIEQLAARAGDEAVDEETAEKVLAMMRRGQTEAAEAFQRDRERGKRRRPDDDPYLKLLGYVCKFHAKGLNARG